MVNSSRKEFASLSRNSFLMTFLARLDEVQEELLYYQASALAGASALAKSLTLKFFM